LSDPSVGRYFRRWGVLVFTAMVRNRGRSGCCGDFCSCINGREREGKWLSVGCWPEMRQRVVEKMMRRSSAAVFFIGEGENGDGERERGRGRRWLHVVVGKREMGTTAVWFSPEGEE
ncbi:hypothetical protein HAX54_044825, partial [Datura stramonium]|nr:hypothetical protein [Datura stramonium]